MMKMTMSAGAPLLLALGLLVAIGASLLMPHASMREHMRTCGYLALLHHRLCGSGGRAQGHQCRAGGAGAHAWHSAVVGAAGMETRGSTADASARPPLTAGARLHPSRARVPSAARDASRCRCRCNEAGLPAVPKPGVLPMRAVLA